MLVAYWLLALPLGYYLGAIVADNAMDGTAGFWKAMIAGIGLAALLVVVRLRGWLNKPLPELANT